jgi:hypothetical protein
MDDRAVFGWLVVLALVVLASVLLVATFDRASRRRGGRGR